MALVKASILNYSSKKPESQGQFTGNTTAATYRTYEVTKHHRTEIYTAQKPQLGQYVCRPWLKDTLYFLMVTWSLGKELQTNM